MRKSSAIFVSGVAIAAVSWLAVPYEAHAVTLTGAIVYDGQNDGYGWTSSTVGGGYSVYVAPNSPTGAFINASDGTVNYNLSLGQNVFYIFGFGDLPLSYPQESTFGLNVFIDSTAANPYSAPQLSGTTAANYGSGATFSSSPLTATTAGSLTYTAANLLLTLTDFNFKIPNASGSSTGYDRVSAFAPTPSNAAWNNAVGEFTISVLDTSVTAVPLHSSWQLNLIGLASIGFMAYRRKLRPAVMVA